jgi:hypothetical protein
LQKVLVPLVLGGIDDISEMSLKADKILLKWCIEAYMLLTLEVSSTVTNSQVIETKSHPYAENEDYTGEISFPGAVNLQITWDPNCSSENNYDHLFLWKDSSKNDTSMIRGQGDSGKWTGTLRECWPNTVVKGNSIFWKWHSDGSNNDWGFRMTVTAVMPNFGDTERVRNEIVLNDGTSPLSDIVSNLTDIQLRKLANTALTSLVLHEGARKQLAQKDSIQSMLKFVMYPLYEVITDVGVNVSREIDQSSEMVGMCPNGFVLIIDNKKIVRETAEPEPFTRLHIAHPNE